MGSTQLYIIKIVIIIRIFPPCDTDCQVLCKSEQILNLISKKGLEIKFESSWREVECTFCARIRLRENLNGGI